MENDNRKESNESFESVIRILTVFVNDTLSLSERYVDVAFFFNSNHVSNTFEIMETKILKYWNEPQNIKTLQHYIKVLERFTDKKIKEELPDGSMSNWVCPPEDEGKRKVVKGSIKNTIAFIKKILDRQKILSPRTKYFDYKGTSQRMFAFETELIKGQLIERTKYFLEIFQGKAPNDKINWTGTASSFRYFIENLFFTELFENLTEKWIIAENSFTINGNPVPKNIRTYKDKDVKTNIQRIINDAISRLID